MPRLTRQIKQWVAALIPGEPPLQKKSHRRLGELTEAEVLRLWWAPGDRERSDKE